MSPPQVSGLVAMAMPQQKEACVWGPVPGGEEEDKGRRETGFACDAHSALQSGLTGRRKSGSQVRDSAQAGTVCRARSFENVA